MAKKILIMDEEYWSIQPAIDRIHFVFGEDVTTYCASGYEGLTRLQEAEFGCVILDIMFPLGEEMDSDEDSTQSIRGGLIVLGEIRKKLRMSIPVICFTIRDDEEVKQEIKKYQNTFHISKLNNNGLEILIIQLKKYLN
jgi:CheY-like chemotaxis protein